MVANNTINIQREIKETLNSSDEDYFKAKQLLKEGLVSERLGGYLIAIVHMKSCLDVATLVLKQGDKIRARRSFSDAKPILDLISRTYGPPLSEPLPKLVEIAKEFYCEGSKKYHKLLSGETKWNKNFQLNG